MKFIELTPNPSGAYPGLQSDPAPGLLAFPDKFIHAFYLQDKQCAGFVTIKHDGQIVTSCIWNEEAYQAYLAEAPTPESDPPTEPQFLGQQITDEQLERIELGQAYTDLELAILTGGTSHV